MHTIPDERLMAIHKAIHDGSKAKVLLPVREGKMIPHNVTVAPNGCRQVIYDGVTFMEQNKRKNSTFGRMARMGDKITWGIHAGRWIKIVNDKILHKEDVFDK